MFVTPEGQQGEGVPELLMACQMGRLNSYWLQLLLVVCYATWKGGRYENRLYTGRPREASVLRAWGRARAARPDPWLSVFRPDLAPGPRGPGSNPFPFPGHQQSR